MSFRLELLKEEVVWAQSLDEAASKITARLEDKAQQTGGMAGLFLAAAFGFVKPESVAGILHGSGMWAAILLMNIIVILLLSLTACLSVLWLRAAPTPLSLATLEDLNEDILGLPPERLSDAVQENYYRDRVKVWEQILEGRATINEDKARRLKIAQTMLAAGMLAVSVLLFAVIRGMLL